MIPIPALAASRLHLSLTTHDSVQFVPPLLLPFRAFRVVRGSLLSSLRGS